MLVLAKSIKQICEAQVVENKNLFGDTLTETITTSIKVYIVDELGREYQLLNPEMIEEYIQLNATDYIKCRERNALLNVALLSTPYENVYKIDFILGYWVR